LISRGEYVRHVLLYIRLPFCSIRARVGRESMQETQLQQGQKEVPAP
jgi:hypothetical protein